MLHIGFHVFDVIVLGFFALYLFCFFDLFRYPRDGKIVWAIALLVFNVPAMVLYLLFGRRPPRNPTQVSFWP